MLNIINSPALDTLKQINSIIGVTTQVYGRKDLFSVSLLKAVRDNVPTKVILQTVKDAAKDNYLAVVAILGFNLTNEILAV